MGLNGNSFAPKRKQEEFVEHSATAVCSSPQPTGC